MCRCEFLNFRQNYFLALDILDWDFILRLIRADIFHLAQSFRYSLEQGGFCCGAMNYA